ncbi:MAG: LysM peptidoglycan-binding domain-containing protein [Flavitalea sp.]
MIRMKLLVFVMLMLMGVQLSAQNDLTVQGTTPDLYLVHTVSPKETWYSLGRLYNISPKELATYNKTTIEKPLSISQVMRIPLRSNFSQNNAKGADEVLVPVYHTVAEKEWMYRISVNHNKVPIERLEQWNNITKDDVKAGMNLIVGYLKVKAGQSALASQAGKTGPVATTTERAPSPVFKDSQKPVTETPKKETAKADQPVVLKDNSSIPKETPKVETVKASQEVKNVNFKGGYFRSQYDDGGRNASGVSGIFKSTSGWNDGKYYALMNNVPVGTIVKVTFPSNSKSVYAKVLGQMPDMKESLGLTIRISEAAATELGAGNSKFGVEVKY